MQLWLNLRNRVPYQDFDDLEPKDCPPNPREEPKALLAPLPILAQPVQGFHFFSPRLVNLFKIGFYNNPGKIYLYNLTESDFLIF